MKRIVVFCLLLFGFVGSNDAAELLIADRLSNSVYRYSESGAFIGVLVSDPANLSEPNGMALSPDLTKLYVASRLNNQVVQYDYNGTSATNPVVLISSGVDGPASLLFSADGSKLYVSDLGTFFNGVTVGQFNPNGTSAGADLMGGEPAQQGQGRTGLAFAPGGELLVGRFQNGGVLRYNSTTSSFEDFIAPELGLIGTGNLLVNRNDLYLAAGFAGRVAKFNATTGAPDASFAVGGLGFPASLSFAPDGNGFLVGDLAGGGGTGQINRYAFNGTFLGIFADSVSDPALGFTDASGLLVSPIPEPSMLILGALAALAGAMVMRRLKNCRV
jgi:DNA-binding beta-propeller fold protein YncE